MYGGGQEELSREVSSALQLTGRRARFKSCQVQGFGVIVNFKCVSKHLDVWLVILNKPKGLVVGEIAF